MFTLFTRKPKSGERRILDLASGRVSDTTLLGPTTVEVAALREAARQTVAKIDRIESEMISDPASARRASGLPAGVEEASVLYANGQPQAAVTTLRSTIARLRGRAGERYARRMLLDVLRAVGDRPSYETDAREFARRFGAPAPRWDAREPAREAGEPAAEAIRFPERLDAGALDCLERARAAAREGRPAALDFGGVVAVDPAMAAQVARTVDAFEQLGLPLIVAGPRGLLAAARAGLGTEPRDAPDGAWRLALLAARLLGARELYERIAADFRDCREASAPAWQAAPPHFAVRPDAAAGDRADADRAEPGVAGVAPSPSPPAEAGDVDVIRLQGEVLGRHGGALPGLSAGAAPARFVAIDCRALHRLDFEAADELHARVRALRAAGAEVAFVEPSFVVEALLIVMGVHRVAAIRRRRI